MKILLFIISGLLLVVFPVSAANFTPTVLELSAPEVVQYNFDGSNLEIPVDVSGTPASCIFLVYTRDKNLSINDVRNGYLGWHTVNKIDTCIYIGQPVMFETGNNSIVWDGKNQTGNLVEPGAYTYYIWGYDPVNEKILAAPIKSPGISDNVNFVTHDYLGTALSQPIIYSGNMGQNSGDEESEKIRGAWILGNDPGKESLIETTKYWGYWEIATYTPSPYESDMFYQFTTNNMLEGIIRKWTWVPNGDAARDFNWGEFDFSIDTGMGWWVQMQEMRYVGGDLLAATNGDISGGGTTSQLVMVNTITAQESHRIDLSEWWIDIEDGERGGQLTGGPNKMDVRGKYLFLNSHNSCMMQMIEPTSGVERNEWNRWINDNGDYVGDHNFEEDSERPWVCNDYNSGPYKYHLKADSNLFSIFPCFDMGALSFGLLAPDGTGVGYFAYAGENAGGKQSSSFIDYDSPFDGIYCDDSSSDGAWGGNRYLHYVGHDSIKGIITIGGSYILVKSPSGGDILGVDSSLTISWISDGVEKVTIELSTDGGSTWQVIADNIDASSGTYQFTPSGIDSEECLVKITDTANADITDTNNGLFAIREPYIEIISFGEGEKIESKTQYVIKWNSLGVDTVNLFYSPDNGETWISVSENVTTSKNSYTWQVPDVQSQECSIKITDSSNPDIYTVSDVFEISVGFIQVTYPNGGEEFDSGSKVSVQWNASQGVSAVTVAFSSDGGTSWTTIAENISADTGLYSLRLPLLTSNSCIIRVASSTIGDFWDVSDGYFTIKPSEDDTFLKYTTQDGLGSDYVWTITQDINGQFWAGTDGGGMAHFDGSTWNRVDSPDGVFKIKIDADNVFWVGPVWDRIQSYHDGAWQTYSNGPDNPRDIVIDGKNNKWIGSWTSGLWKFDGTTWTNYTTGNSELKANHPEVLALDRDDNLWIGYMHSNGASHFDGTNWTHYSEQDGLASDIVRNIYIADDGVVWFVTNSGVSRFDGTNWQTYRTGDGLVSNDTWAVTVDHTNVVWVGASGGISAYDGVDWKSWSGAESGLGSTYIDEIEVDENNAKWFATRGSGILRFDYQLGAFIGIESPNGGEILGAGTVATITWTSNDVEKVTIEFSQNNGLTWQTVANNIDAESGFYSLSLPDIESNFCLIRISDSSNSDVTDTSAQPFTVSPPFVRVISPNGGERWAYGTAHTIRWEGVGIQTLSIELSTDNGNSWSTIVEEILFSSGQYSWDIPETESTNCIVRLSDSTNSERFDISDNNFTIMESFIQVLTPNGGELIDAGKQYDITWESDGVDRFSISFSVDGGITWNVIANNVDRSVSSYKWYPTNVSSSLCILRISDVNRDWLYDDSDGTFNINFIAGVDENTPNIFTLDQNYPNPFNPVTTISFNLPQKSQVTLKIYSALGEEVATLTEDRFSAGRHSVEWDASGFSSGIYFYRLEAGEFTETKKLLLLK